MTTPRPNIVLILADDMGFSDLGCYGSEIETPHLDALAARGVRLTRFTNTARCSPSRASMLTGLHPHQTGIGVLTDDDGPGGYPGSLNQSCRTMAEVLGAAGYETYMSGKWHVSHQKNVADGSWPTRRGFQRFYGTLDGCGSYFAPRRLTRDEEDVSVEAERDPDYYYTDAVADAAVEFIAEHHRTQPADSPFLCYVAFTAPHFPLQARESEIARYAGRYAEGWDVVRAERIERLRQLGLLEDEVVASDRDPEVPAWEDVPDHEWEARRMEVYAAQVTAMDTGIGRIVDTLREIGELDTTLLLFLSDNGGSAEAIPPGRGADYAAAGVRIIPAATRAGGEIQVGNLPDVWPGPESTYATYGRAWANVSNAPFRLFKTWMHEGGIASPLIVHWPAGLGDQAGKLCRGQFYMPDLLPTLIEVGEASYPLPHDDREVLPLEGVSMLPSLRGEPTEITRAQFYEHEGNAAVRRGRWKLVRDYPRDWELYDLDADPTERDDQAVGHPELVKELATAWVGWARRCGVIPRERILELGRWGLITVEW